MPMGTQDEAATVANQQPNGLQESDARLAAYDRPVDTPGPRGPGMSDEDKAQLARLQAQKAEADRADSEPTEDNFTHWLHLADGRVKLARGAAGSVYSEGAGTQNDPEKFTPIVATYARIV